MSYQFGQIDPEERSELADDDQIAAAAPRRRGLPATLLTLAVMALFSGALWFAYVAGTRHAPRQDAGADAPLIRADQHPTRVKPEQPGGMEIPDQDKHVFNETPGGPPVERLLPQPEAPMPRQMAAAPQPESAAPETASPPVPLSTLAPAPPRLTQPSPAIAASQQQALAPTGPIPARASPATAHPPLPAKAGGIRIQLGAMRSEELARREWERLKRANPELLGKMSAVAVRADLGAKGVFYRIQAGPIADPAAAERLCGALKERHLGCIIAR